MKYYIKINKNLLLLFISIIYVSNAYSQDTFEVTPPSPNVASLGKYGEIPVSKYTGIPNVSIPLYEIKSGSLSLPISLSYHASGVKVEEVASSVGLGWSLNAGGVIGRSVRGMADEFFGWFVQDESETIEEINRTSGLHDFAQKVYDNIVDGEADMYFYNFAGQSGKFIFNQLGNAHTIPYSKLKITKSPHLVITTGDGTVYNFKEDEIVQTSHGCTGDDTSATTAWYLSSIISSDRTDSINFTYELVNYSFATLNVETLYTSKGNGDEGCQTPEINGCVLSHGYHTRRLKRIDFSNGYVKFNHNNIRCDLSGDKSLDQIEIYTKDSTLIKKYDFNYSYFGDNNDGCQQSTEIYKRLKLLSVTEKSSDSSNPPFLFEYDESKQLPHRQSYQQDHWGFYNGQITNQSLISDFRMYKYDGSSYFVDGADRNTYPEFAKTGVLTKITYPTGGYTKFTYESNTSPDERLSIPTIERKKISLYNPSDRLISSIPDPYESSQLIIPEGGAEIEYKINGINSLQAACDIVDLFIMKDGEEWRRIDDAINGAKEIFQAGTYKLKLEVDKFYCSVDGESIFEASIIAHVPVLETGGERFVGGLRIKQIEDEPLGNGAPVIKKYSYQQEDDPSKSSGVLINFPDYGYDMIIHSKHNLNPNPGGAPMIVYKSCNYHVRRSYSNYPLSTTQGSYVGYRNVIEYIEGNGESRYTFRVFNDDTPSFPFAPIDNHFWENGILVNKKDFKEVGGSLRKVKEIWNSYSEGGPYDYVMSLKTGCNELDLRGFPGNTCNPVYRLYQNNIRSFAIKSTTQRVYDSEDESKFVETITDYNYNNQHYLLDSKTISDSKNGQYEFKYWYPEDYNNIGTIPSLISKNIVGIPIKEEVYYDNNIISGNIIKPNTYGKPLEIYKYEVEQIQTPPIHNENIIVPSGYEKKTTVGYDPITQNISNSSPENDINVSYIWGYNDEYPIAKLENLEYSSIPSSIITNLKDISNADDSDEAEDTLRSELNNLRDSFPNAMVTTYTYDPLVGVTSITDPKGYTTYYEYDDFNRLKHVKDNDRKILSDTYYHYKN